MEKKSLYLTRHGGDVISKKLFNETVNRIVTHLVSDLKIISGENEEIKTSKYLLSLFSPSLSPLLSSSSFFLAPLGCDFYPLLHGGCFCRSNLLHFSHAPFIFWISDLSQPDGLGITPLLMGISMYIQQKMTPQTAMMDSTQVKIMQMLPFIFTIFSFTFPSGLTMYWVTSNVLSIAQQQIINRIKTPEMQD